MTVDLVRYAEENRIRYFLISYTDMFATARAKLVPSGVIGDMAEAGAGFAGFASWLDMSPADPDIAAVPDPDSVTRLPWKPDVAWLAADLWMEGEPVAQAPRNVLKRALAAAEDAGYRLRTGVECEYFVIDPGGADIADGRDIQPKPCYDQQALMRRYDLIAEICDAMQTLAWGPYQNDHEDANGQFEMNWDYADGLVTADRHVFFKYMVKSLAEKHGLRATFMPKPFAHLTGNGCHAHVSLWDRSGDTNLFLDTSGELGLSPLAYRFIGGVMHAAPALCALTNPTVNSYKRINAPVTASGATWAPNAVTYGGNNRTHMIRIPDAGRFELRLADGAVNPYLLSAGLVIAGLDGIANERSPGKRLDFDLYAEPQRARGARKLPLNLLDALRALDRSRLLRAGLGREFVDGYVKLKTDEWNDYTRHLTSWEREHTLDC